jgi:hypothetical protein
MMDHHGTAAPGCGGAGTRMKGGGQQGAAPHFSQCPADQEGTALRGRRVPGDGRNPRGAQVGIRLKDERQPDAGGLEGKDVCRGGRRREERIGGFPGVIAGAGAAVVGLLLAVVFTAATAGGLLLLLGLDLLGRATAERAGDQKGQQAGEDGSEARHRW